MSSVLILLAAFVVTAFANESLYSLVDLEGVKQSIQQYSSPNVFSEADYDAVTNALTAPIEGAPSWFCPTTTVPDANCTITSPYNASTIASIVKECTNIAVKDLTVPGNQTLNLKGTQDNTVITFYGRTTWEYFPFDYDLVQFKGTNLTIQGSPGSVLDGNGAAWWDGQGSNGGTPKPDHMLTISGESGYIVIRNLYIKNAPTHVFSISHADSLYAVGNVIDGKDGEMILSNGLAAGHNTDGWDLATTTNSIVTNNAVFNQDDCVALTSGENVVIGNFYCDGGHGLSIGSVGGKSNNTVENIVFRDSIVVNSQNGCRIKANSNTTGSVDAVTYENIVMHNISIYGIDVQQDYLNGGPTGMPTPGVNITNISLKNVTGDVQPDAYNYYILVAVPQTDASTWTFEDVHVTGGNASCDSTPPGFTCTKG